MRTETMIAGAVALASAYNTRATPFAFFSDGAPAETGLPHLPYDFFVPVALAGVVATIAFIALGAEDLANGARENPHRQFKPLNLYRY